MGTGNLDWCILCSRDVSSQWTLNLCSMEESMLIMNPDIYIKDIKYFMETEAGDGQGIADAPVASLGKERCW